MTDRKCEEEEVPGNAKGRESVDTSEDAAIRTMYEAVSTYHLLQPAGANER